MQDLGSIFRVAKKLKTTPEDIFQILSRKGITVELKYSTKFAHEWFEIVESVLKARRRIKNRGFENRIYYPKQPIKGQTFTTSLTS
ncbi:MAG: hypothetical protein H6573_33605 [Lewinellaceae bacterium]|nr:hypothetical protein [Lewinellaceae bacterium]